MPRPNPESHKAWHPAYWADSLSLSADQKEALFQKLAESAGLDIRHPKDEQKAATLLGSVLALLGSYKSLEGLYDRPHAESRLAELKQLERSMERR